MDGEGFEAYVGQGDYVKAGDPLITFDVDLVRKKAKGVITPVIITNGDDLDALEKTDDGEVEAGKSALLKTNVKAEVESETPAASAGEYSEEAGAIVAALGGEDNISVATHCVTRLRFALNDEGKINNSKLENLDIVKGSFMANGQFQVVIGQGTVDKVYAAMVNETAVELS